MFVQNAGKKIMIELSGGKRNAHHFGSLPEKAPLPYLSAAGCSTALTTAFHGREARTGPKAVLMLSVPRR